MSRFTSFHELRIASLTGFCAAADVAVNAMTVNASTVFFIVMSPCLMHFRLKAEATGSGVYRWYFQFRLFLSEIHCTAVSRRRPLVSSDFESVIHSTYSRWLDALQVSHAACAFLFLLIAASM